MVRKSLGFAKLLGFHLRVAEASLGFILGLLRLFGFHLRVAEASLGFILGLLRFLRISS